MLKNELLIFLLPSSEFRKNLKNDQKWTLRALGLSKYTESTTNQCVI